MCEGESLSLSRHWTSIGFTYKIRYHLDLKGNKILQNKATYTTNTTLESVAVELGFEKRIEVLKNYTANKISPVVKGKSFFKMLLSYYDDGSEYLKADNDANKREVVYKARKEAQTFIETDLIP